MKDIRHIATSFEGQIVALAEFEKRVQIFDITSLQVISEFDTILDFGGHRLVISEDGKICICGCWERHGICAYETESGKIVWQRKDLKKVQHIQIIQSDLGKIFACFNAGKSRILDITSGEDIGSITGAKWYFESNFKPLTIIDKADKIQVIDRLNDKTKFNIGRQSFASLSLAISDIAFAVSESGGPLSCYSLESGKLQWQISLNEDGHFLRVCFNKKLDDYIGISWPFMKGGNKKIKYISKTTGIINKQKSINCPVETEFALNGMILITSDREVYNLETGEKKSWI